MRRLTHQGFLTGDLDGVLRPVSDAGPQVAACFSAAIRITGGELRRLLTGANPKTSGAALQDAHKSASGQGSAFRNEPEQPQVSGTLQPSGTPESNSAHNQSRHDKENDDA